MVKLLINDTKIDVNKITKRGYYTGFSLVRNIDIIKILMENDRIDISIPKEFTPFHDACYQGFSEHVKLFLEDSRMDVISLNSVDYHGKTPFYWACRRSDIDTIKLLIEDERIDVNIPNEDGMTPFHIACATGTASVVRLLLNEPRVKINDDPIIYDICQCIDGNVDDECMLEIVDIFKVLFEDGRFDPNKGRPDGDIDPYKIMNMMTFGSDKNEVGGKTPFHVLCSKNYIHNTYIKLFLENDKVNVNKKDNKGQTPFMYACIHTPIEIIDLLIKSDRTDTNITDCNGLTAFYRACIKGDKDVIEYLLDNCDNIVLPDESDDKMTEEVQKLLNKYR